MQNLGWALRRCQGPQRRSSRILMHLDRDVCLEFFLLVGVGTECSPESKWFWSYWEMIFENHWHFKRSLRMQRKQQDKPEEYQGKEVSWGVLGLFIYSYRVVVWWWWGRQMSGTDTCPGEVQSPDRGAGFSFPTDFPQSTNRVTLPAVMGSAL